MGTIQSSIQITDGMSPAFRAMNNAMMIVLNTFDNIQAASHNAIDTSSIESARNQLNIAGAEFTRIEEQIEAARNSQDQFNNSVKNGAGHASKLKSIITKMVGAYAGFQGAKALIGLSDSYAQTNARLNLMNDGLQSTAELQNLIYYSAQKSRGAYLDTANLVAKLGVNAADAFDSSAQIVAFAEQVNKQFVISGATTEEMSASLLQLTQALASGVLRGDELRSIFEQAPTLIRSVADYMGVSVGQIRELAAEGQVTAEIVKNALLSSADETNAKFEAMPMTWAQIWTSITNIATKASDVILQKINSVANYDKLQNLINGFMGAFSVIVDVAGGAMEVVGAVAGFMYDNWSVIAPIILGVATALAIYTAALVVHNTVQGISSALKGIAAIAAVAHGTATAAEMAATVGMTEAQLTFNAALYACPITWIIIAIIAVIAIIYAVIAVINKVAETSYSATGVIAGSFTTVGAVIANIFLGIVDIALGVVETVVNCFIDLANFLGNVFNDPVTSIIRLFENMLDSVMNIIQHIASALDKVFGGNLEYQVDVARTNWANKANDNKIYNLNKSTIDEANTADVAVVIQNAEEWSDNDYTKRGNAIALLDKSWNGGYKEYNETLPGEHWAEKHVISAYHKGILSDKEYWLTNLDDNISIADLLALIDKMTGGMVSTYVDRQDVDHWGRNHLDSLCDKRLITEPEKWIDFEAPVTNNHTKALINNALLVNASEFKVSPGMRLRLTV